MLKSNLSGISSFKNKKTIIAYTLFGHWNNGAGTCHDGRKILKVIFRRKHRNHVLYCNVFNLIMKLHEYTDKY